MQRSTTLTAMFTGALLAVPSLPAAATSHAAGIPNAPEQAQIERGRYLVRIAGCNDCHTPGYLTNDGEVPEEAWLTGDRLGWRGPWGTTYASNLRLFIDALEEEQWVETARTLKRRPPMPWFNLNRMTEEDLRAIYRFVRDLGPAGEPAPDYVVPNETPAGPYAQFPAPPSG